MSAPDATATDNNGAPHAPYDGELREWEYFWRDHQKWLEERGYMLRRRYKTDWVPSWKGTDKLYWRCEDGQLLPFPQIIDATRLSDGTTVSLKKVSLSRHPYEVEIGRFFSSEPLASDPRNHCVPIYDVLNVPDDDDICILVMPLLRANDSPRFQTVGEAVEFFRQLFEGLQFMHSHSVAHRDCMDLNVMMDPRPLYPKLYHPAARLRSRDYKGTAKHYTRTAHPVRYYLIDFGLSRKYNPDDGPPSEDPIRGGDKTVPEFQNLAEPCNPFPTDIYYIGNLIREHFIQQFHGLNFMLPLVSDMVQEEPGKRPSIDEVVSRFAEIHRQLRYWQLRSRLVPVDEPPHARQYRTIRHFFRTIGYIIMFRPPVPTPPARGEGWFTSQFRRLRRTALQGGR